MFCYRYFTRLILALFLSRGLNVELDTYRLILETLTAFGTVGAVIISLWMSRPNKPRFKVKAADSRIDMALNKSSQLRLHEHYLLVNIENLRDVQMQVFSVFLRIFG